MINYQTQQETIRLIKSQLLGYQIKSILSLAIGINCLIFTPILGKDFSQKSKLINLSGFILGLSSLSYCLIINAKLREFQGKNQMIKELEKSLFIDEQLVIYQNYRQPILQPITEVQPSQTNNTNQLTENLQTPTTNNLQTYTNTSTNSLSIDDSKIQEVIEALENDTSDTFIIENILGYKGRNFSKGKEVLTIIKNSLE